MSVWVDDFIEFPSSIIYLVIHFYKRTRARGMMTVYWPQHIRMTTNSIVIETDGGYIETHQPGERKETRVRSHQFSAYRRWRRWEKDMKRAEPITIPSLFLFFYPACWPNNRSNWGSERWRWNIPRWPTNPQVSYTEQTFLLLLLRKRERENVGLYLYLVKESASKKKGD